MSFEFDMKFKIYVVVIPERTNASQLKFFEGVMSHELIFKLRIMDTTMEHPEIR